MNKRNYFYMTRRIGSTLYKVKIHLAENGTETMEDKFLRIIQNHILADGEFCDIMESSQMSRSA